ncbi:group I truncated hemoglobin [Halococcus hamelinensis]|uniref:Cyanoglobin n=1 Tax=Halococcus hamelinensis 100A6 TaxID=1132509 RepID=M0M373_9EURY|nr:group 1 truncated hemoglobin [Halococcus hamelinensis]EMA39029.1 cyanoglobin [Halococcus hamelinensis 100A6]
MTDSVYEEIGGKAAVEAVVEDFYDRVLSDDRLVGFFDGTDMAELRAHQVQFISAVAGGPMTYSGDEMRDAHRHLDIREADFEAVGTHLERALRENGVDEANIAAIMDEVSALEDPILGR